MNTICITVEPGVCGFCCQVQARRQNKHKASIEITGSQCKMIQKLAENLQEVSMQDMFVPHTRNPVFKAAEQAGCHLTCSVPIAVLKAAEAALDLALQQEARICFVQEEE